ncbi:hypothetical protein JOB18_040617 [Solea senegalensis]|uniref:Uncharacterized protein n=1 Tax=Solea senegalensis TaxID=28829 RepID=A0AAV6S162_SOLSE|nr:hypothetical protein JOB18_040617 [Solea senegalensis]
MNEGRLTNPSDTRQSFGNGYVADLTAGTAGDVMMLEGKQMDTPVPRCRGDDREKEWTYCMEKFLTTRKDIALHCLLRQQTLTCQVMDPDIYPVVKKAVTVAHFEKLRTQEMMFVWTTKRMLDVMHCCDDVPCKVFRWSCELH